MNGEPLGEAHWITLVVLAIFVVGFGAMAMESWLSNRRYRARKRRLICPNTNQDVHLEAALDMRTGCWTGVYTGRRPGVACHNECVEPMNRGALVSRDPPIAVTGPPGE